jgi:glycosyltransferase involved in cell wall biosynthesis
MQRFHQKQTTFLPTAPYSPSGLLSHLPPPPAGKTGWPWTEETAPAVYNEQKDWLKISIVTPSFNQAGYLEETIRSVLLQNYPNLEYIIIDGGSTDESVEILKKYSPWLSYWVSEKDKGQSHAINKGFQLATGEWMNWLCSDDILARDCLFKLIQEVQPNSQWMLGKELYCDGDSNITQYPSLVDRSKISPNLLLFGRFIIPQVTSFWRRDLWHQAGAYVDIDLHYAMDYELWLRFAKLSSPKIGSHGGIARVHSAQKTNQESGITLYVDECDRVRCRFLKGRIPLWYAELLVNFHTRRWMASRYGWTSWFRPRPIGGLRNYWSA